MPVGYVKSISFFFILCMFPLFVIPDKQREEQRLKKQMEKERDRAGVQDQWADRFVYHKSPRQSSPRRAQYE